MASRAWPGSSSSQATEAAGQWIEFSTDNAAFAPVVAGVRSQDLAEELALKGPLSLGPRRNLDGHAGRRHRRDADIRARSPSTSSSTSAAQGSHVPVEEDSVNAKGEHTAAEHIVYSKWGEQVRPEAPKATISDRFDQRRLRRSLSAA